MKTYLRDVTFLLLVRLDSIERMENLLIITEQLCRHFDTNIVVLEADKRYTNILKKILNKHIHYIFVEDKDPVLYKTFYFNRMAQKVITPYLAIWDADIVIDKNAIITAVKNLRKGMDVAFPYNGQCYDVSPVIRELYLRKNDIRILYRHKNKMDLFHNRSLVGGAIFVRMDKYKYCGMENENHYGWGNDDFDRYYRLKTLGMNIYRSENPLFHLFHPRLKNSTFRSFLHNQKTNRELSKTENSSLQELLTDLRNKE